MYKDRIVIQPVVGVDASISALDDLAIGKTAVKHTVHDQPTGVAFFDADSFKNAGRDTAHRDTNNRIATLYL